MFGMQFLSQCILKSKGKKAKELQTEIKFISNLWRSHVDLAKGIQPRFQEIAAVKQNYFLKNIYLKYQI